MRRPSGPLGILLTVTGVCAVLITAVVVGFVLWLNYRPPDIKGLVKSPDGRWEAYISRHGFLDNTKGCLYLRAKGGQVVEGPQICGSDISIGKLVWSPDLKRVAWILWSQVPYQVDSLYVFDLQARHPSGPAIRARARSYRSTISARSYSSGSTPTQYRWRSLIRSTPQSRSRTSGCRTAAGIAFSR